MPGRAAAGFLAQSAVCGFRYAIGEKQPFERRKRLQFLAGGS
jgi:hypothetical protein